ncbi:MAG: NAD(P)H-hydrate epimerase [Gemmatimonadota bacterium]|nr:NAD(P)H-hydrate epimerase [Gemmatimonadota bacterium]
MVRVQMRPTLGGVPCVSADEMRTVDRVTIEDFGVTLIQMMENAGRALALVVRALVVPHRTAGAVAVLAGPGGNGGGALAAARRLHGWGLPVVALLSEDQAKYRGAPGAQLDAVRRLGIPIIAAGGTPPSKPPALVVDGLVGYALSGPPRGQTAALIEWTRELDAPIVALDVPTGIDPTTGEVREPAIRATTTVTLALPKSGLAAAAARPFVGAVFLADIGVPPEVYTRPPLNLTFETPFVRHDLVRLHDPSRDGTE